MPKLTPEELLRAIENAPTSAGEDPDNNGAPDPFDAAVAEVLAMTPEERRRDLEAAGVDVEKMHADTAALLGRTPAKPASPSARPPVPSLPQAPRSAPPRAPIPLPARRRLRPVLLLAAAIALVTAAAAAYRTYFAPRESQEQPPATAPAHSSHAPHAPSPSAPSSSSSSGPTLDIAALRKEGLDACRAQRWQPCEDRLDLADRFDPAGSQDPLVVLARSQASLALRGSEAGADDGTENAKQPGSMPVPSGSGPR